MTVRYAGMRGLSLDMTAIVLDRLNRHIAAERHRNPERLADIFARAVGRAEALRGAVAA